MVISYQVWWFARTLSTQLRSKHLPLAIKLNRALYTKQKQLPSNRYGSSQDAGEYLESDEPEDEQ